MPCSLIGQGGGLGAWSEDEARARFPTSDCDGVVWTMDVHCLPDCGLVNGRVTGGCRMLQIARFERAFAGLRYRLPGANDIFSRGLPRVGISPKFSWAANRGERASSNGASGRAVQTI